VSSGVRRGETVAAMRASTAEVVLFDIGGVLVRLGGNEELQE
jgi:hypothetical protein